MRSFLLISIIVLCWSCDDQFEMEPVAEIRYGTSFGECIGYCFTETSITATTVTVKASNGNTGEDKVHTANLTDDQYQKVIKGINLQAFQQLPEIIGCPDCADGGAEWLEINLDGGLHKVTFEYGEEIKGIADGIKELRTLTATYYPEE